MSIYAQHGYGKSDKIETAIRSDHISGLVLSPRDEHPDNMAGYINFIRQEFGDRVRILFDPQFYATTLHPVREANLPSYPYYQTGLTRGNFIAQADIRRYVEDTISYQNELNLDRIISPSVLFNDFRDPWSQISLSLARESMVFHEEIQGAPPLLISLVVDEHALKSREALDEFLDIISIWDVRGYYLLIRLHDLTYPALLEEDVLLNLLYVVYALSVINGFEFVCGYSDILGLLLLAVGATGIGTGWFHTLRQFTLTRFLPSTGGRQPRSRYTSASLLNSIFIVPELQMIYDLNLFDRVRSNTSYDAAFASRNPADASWPPNVACLHHWEVLSQIARDLSSRDSVSQRIEFLENRIRGAIAVYRYLEARGVIFDSITGTRDLELWLHVIAAFKREASL